MLACDAPLDYSSTSTVNKVYDSKTLVSVMTDAYVYNSFMKQRLSKMCAGVKTEFKNHGLAIVHFLISGFKRTNRNQLDSNKSRG